MDKQAYLDGYLYKEADPKNWFNNSNALPEGRDLQTQGKLRYRDWVNKNENPKADSLISRYHGLGVGKPVNKDDFYNHLGSVAQNSLPSRIAGDEKKRPFITAGLGGALGAGAGGLLGGGTGSLLGGTLGALAGWLAEHFYKDDMNAAYKVVSDWLNKGILSREISKLDKQYGEYIGAAPLNEAQRKILTQADTQAKAKKEVKKEVTPAVPRTGIPQAPVQKAEKVAPVSQGLSNAGIEAPSTTLKSEGSTRSPSISNIKEEKQPVKTGWITNPWEQT